MPTPFDDLAPFFDAGEATAATWTRRHGNGVGVPGQVWLDAPDEDALEDVRASAHRITYRVEQWSDVREGDRVLIGADLYTVRRVGAIDDGLLARADLQRVG